MSTFAARVRRPLRRDGVATATGATAMPTLILHVAREAPGFSGFTITAFVLVPACPWIPVFGGDDT